MRSLTTSRRGITYARQHGLLCEMIDGTDPANKWRLAILNHHRARLEGVLRKLERDITINSLRQPFHA